jgi:hypothetical protein
MPIIAGIQQASIDSAAFHGHVIELDGSRKGVQMYTRESSSTLCCMSDCWSYFMLLHGDERPEWSKEQLSEYLRGLVTEYRQVTLDMIRRAYDDEQSPTVG